MEWKTLIILCGDTCCNSRSHPHKNQYNYTTDILHFYFWQNGTGSSLFLKPATDAKVFGFLGASFSRFGVLVFEFWVLRFWVLGSSFSSFGCFVFEIWVLRFRDLGASCFGLRFRVLRFRNYPICCGAQRTKALSRSRRFRSPKTDEFERFFMPFSYSIWQTHKNSRSG